MSEPEYAIKDSAQLVANCQAASAHVAAFLRTDLFPLVSGIEPHSSLDTCFWGYFQRLEPTIRGVSLLTQVSLFQLAFAGTRTLLEILVDLLLLSGSNPADAPDRIEAWELSAKLKAAECELGYVKRVGASGKSLALQQEFVDRSGERIRTLRVAYWPERRRPEVGRHPDRWTGRTLLQDCQIADPYDPSLGLERFYETTYRHMNWSIHGSGFAGVRGLDVHGIELLCAQSHLYSSRFALAGAHLVARGLGLIDAQLASKLENAKFRWYELALKKVP